MACKQLFFRVIGFLSHFSHILTLIVGAQTHMRHRSQSLNPQTVIMPSELVHRHLLITIINSACEAQLWFRSITVYILYLDEEHSVSQRFFPYCPLVHAGVSLALVQIENKFI